MNGWPSRWLQPAMAAWVAACALLMGRSATADEPAIQPMNQSMNQTVDQAVAAVWKQQEISFYYRSFTTFYPCASLNAKVRRMLLVLGASHDLKVRSSGCGDGQVGRSPMVSIQLSSPVEATPAALAALAKTRATRELVARVRGGNAALESVDAQFPAQWQRVALSRNASLRLDAGDCELVNEFKRKVIPQLSIRIVQDDLRCSAYGMSSQTQLQVEALQALPPASPSDGKLAATGDS